MKESAARPSGRARENHQYKLVAIVVVVIPIAIGMPAVAVFVPPTMPLIPAAFACLVQVVARTVRLPAVPAVILDGFVESVVRLGDAALAMIVGFGRRAGCCSKCQHAQKRRRYQQGPS
jgi:hypothetical protein